VPIAVGDALSFEASLKTADAAMTRANNAIIAAIDLSRPRLSEFLCMNRAPAADASVLRNSTLGNNRRSIDGARSDKTHSR
jgi:hypothetical protein